MKLETFTCNNGDHTFWVFFALFVYICSLFKLLSKGKYKLNKDAIYKQRLFWVAIGTPAYGFVVSGFTVWSGCSLTFNAQGYRNFIEISTLPTSILAFTIPFAVLVGHIHRTVQTSAQIKESENSNSINRQKHEVELLLNKIEVFYKQVESLNNNLIESLRYECLSLQMEITADELKTSLINSNFYKTFPYTGKPLQYQILFTEKFYNAQAELSIYQGINNEYQNNLYSEIKNALVEHKLMALGLRFESEKKLFNLIINPFYEEVDLDYLEALTKGCHNNESGVCEYQWLKTFITCAKEHLRLQNSVKIVSSSLN